MFILGIRLPHCFEPDVCCASYDGCMAEPGATAKRVENAPIVPPGLSLVVLLTGFVDAGHTVSGLMTHLREVANPQPVVVFDNDVLFDYRARRPLMTFRGDHLAEFEPPRLDLALAHDTMGQPFLLLTGYEPDFAWESFVADVLAFSVEHEVEELVWLHAIGLPVPHTRPLGVTVSGNRGDLIDLMSVWQPTTQVPATAGHLLEYRYIEAGGEGTGLVLLVPHYLSDAKYPHAVLAAADRLMTATGLVLNMDSVRDQLGAFEAEVHSQVRDEQELTAMVEMLEQRYDAYSRAREQGQDAEDVDALTEASLPSADELAEELQKFLANRTNGDAEPPNPAPFSEDF